MSKTSVLIDNIAGYRAYGLWVSIWFLLASRYCSFSSLRLKQCPFTLQLCGPAPHGGLAHG